MESLTEQPTKKPRRNTARAKASHVERERRRLWRAKLKCLRHYGGQQPSCGCCGESEIGFLTLDHVEKGASSWVRQLPLHYFHYLIRSGFPEEPKLQVLCFNCNLGRSINGGVCPHKQPMSMETYGRPESAVRRKRRARESAT